MGVMTAAGILYAAMLFELAYMLYSLSCNRNKKMIAEASLFAVLLLLLSYLTASAGKAGVLPEKTAAITAFAAVIGIVRAAVLIVLEHGRNKERLSGYSLKQAVDNMDMGILFAEKNGRIILMNRAMENLVSEKTGRIPQSVNELAGIAGGIITDKSGHKWKFMTESIEETVKGCSRMVALNVTEQIEYNERIEAENSALKQTNEKLKAMYEQLADRIREEETLKLRIRIHNDMGCSLIYLRELLEKGDLYGMDRQLDILKDVLSYLKQEKADEPESLKERANELGVKLLINDNWPEDKELRALVSDAVMECVTNCVKHAGGDQLRVGIEHEGERYRIRISNNGKVPEAGIREGGGLGALRRRIEGCGGSMVILSLPAFEMEIILEEKTDDQNSGG